MLWMNLTRQDGITLADIKAKWSKDSIGTGSKSSNGIVYNTMKKAMPGTIVFADKALTDVDYFSIKATINNKYVCADNYGQSNLVANRDSAGAWEQFRVIYNSDGTVDGDVIMYNKPETVEVPSTGTFKTITTSLIGLLIIGLGSALIYRNYKKNNGEI